MEQASSSSVGVYIETTMPIHSPLLSNCQQVCKCFSSKKAQAPRFAVAQTVFRLQKIRMPPVGSSSERLL